MQCILVVFTVLFGAINSEFYDTYSGKEITKTRYERLNRTGLVPYCAIEVPPCDPHEPRRMGAACNNLKYPSRGAALTPFRRMLPPSFGPGGDLRLSQSGKPLPKVRPLRVALMSDGRVSSQQYTQMVTNFNVFITGDITSVHDTVNYVVLTRTCCSPGGRQDPRCIPIEVKPDDVHLRRSDVRCMNLTRSITYQRLGCISDDVPPERINAAAPMLDLSIVYGNEESRARFGREFRRGRLRAELVNGRLWPPTGSRVCINNIPPLETRCHDVPVPDSNAVLGLNLLFIWFYRSHNMIADALWEVNPCWGDDKLYYTAREINIAFAMQIMYYEVMPLLLGWEFLVHSKVVFPTLGHVDDYDPTLPPAVSIDYVASSRWFHTLQEGRIKLYKTDGRYYGEIAGVDMILRTGALPINNTIEGITQGAFRQPGAAVDSVVDPDIGERILGRLQFASDVLSSDMMKGRDVGLPPYNQYRRHCRLPEAKRFKDLLDWMDQPQVEAMASFYSHPDDIDLMAGLLGERAMPGAGVSATLACIMAEQMLYWRRADRFWYEHSGQPGAFTEEQLLEIRKMTMSKFMCQYADAVTEIQPNAFLLHGPGNEITKCSAYKMPNLNAFHDDRCYPKPTPSYKTNPHAHPHKPDYEEQGYNSQDFMGIPVKSNYQNDPNLNPFLSTIQETPNVYPTITNNQGYRNPQNIEEYPNIIPLTSTNKEHNSQNPSISTADMYPKLNTQNNEEYLIRIPLTSTNKQYNRETPSLTTADEYPSPKVTIYPNADPTPNKDNSVGQDYINIKSSSPNYNENYNYPSITKILDYPNDKYSPNFNKFSNANPFN